MTIFKPKSKPDSKPSNRGRWKAYLKLQQYIRQRREEALQKKKRMIWLMLLFLDWMSKMPVWLFCYSAVEQPDAKQTQYYWDEIHIAEIRKARQAERYANPRFPFLPERYRYECPSIITLIDHLALDFAKDDAFAALLWKTPETIHEWMAQAYRAEGARSFRQCCGATSVATLERMIIEADRWKAHIAAEAAKAAESRRRALRPRAKPKATPELQPFFQNIVADVLTTVKNTQNDNFRLSDKKCDTHTAVISNYTQSRDRSITNCSTFGKRDQAFDEVDKATHVVTSDTGSRLHRNIILFSLPKPGTMLCFKACANIFRWNPFGWIGHEFVVPARDFIPKPFFTGVFKVFHHAKCCPDNLARVVVPASFKLFFDKIFVVIAKCKIGHRDTFRFNATI
eukprot:gene32259-41811_t